MDALLQRDVKLALAADSEGVLPVHLACMSGTSACASKLLRSAPQSAVALDSTGASCLHYAAAGGDVELVGKLLSLGCSMVSVDRSGNTPMHFAARSGHAGVIARLFEHPDGAAAAGGNNVFGDSPAMLAAFGGHFAALKRLVQQKGMPRHTDGNDSLLHKAAYGGHVECAAFLLTQMKPDAIDCRGSGNATALHKAATSGSVEVVQMLLRAGADVGARDEEDALPIHKACFWGRTAVVQVLQPLWAKAERTAQGATPLHMAAASGDAACLCLCLSVYEDSAVTSNVGFFTAHFAAKCGRVELLTNALLKYPALLGVKTSEGLSVRDVAIACGNHKFAAALAPLSTNQNSDSNIHSTSFESENNNYNYMSSLNSSNNNNNDNSSKSTGNNNNNNNEDDFYSSNVVDDHADGVREQSSNNHEMVNRAVALFNAKPQKGVQFLIQHKLVEDSPDSIAKFLFDTEALSKKKIGELISENDEASQALANAFLRQLDFAGKDFDAAIRLFLSKFMLPGEAQKIDRVMEMFASRFYQQNPTSVFANADTCYVRFFLFLFSSFFFFSFLKGACFRCYYAEHGLVQCEYQKGQENDQATMAVSRSWRQRRK
jgi:ankyrin repeat protein